ALIGLALIPILLGQKIISHKTPAKVASAAESNAWSRRDFLRFGAAMLPPVFTLSLTGIAMAQLNRVRGRRFVLSIVDVRKEYEGMTIAQVSDMHVGRFTKGAVMQKPVRLVNEM